MLVEICIKDIVQFIYFVSSIEIESAMLWNRKKEIYKKSLSMVFHTLTAVKVTAMNCADIKMSSLCQ